jgi:dihydroneopterin aldolase
MVTIKLDNVRLHGYHGIHEEERKVMNTFEVSLDVSYLDDDASFERIEETISYADLYEILQQKIAVPVSLLEKICLDVIREIKDRYPNVRSVKISIYKLQAPIEHFQGKVGVTMSRQFKI